MNSSDWYARPLIHVNDAVSGRLRSSRLLVRALFGTRVEPGPQGHYWDYTTLVLKKALSRIVHSGQRVLEIGVGDHALLSIHVVKRFAVSLTAVDIVPEVVSHAQRAAALNGAKIDIRQSDMFSNCDGTYDIVFWNIPYVPRRAQVGRRVHRYADVIWDGRGDGMHVIRRCLDEASSHLTAHGRLILGVNTFYVSAVKMKELALSSPLKLECVVKAWGNPSKAFVFSAPTTSAVNADLLTEAPSLT